MRRTLRWILAISTLAGALACSDSNGPTERPPGSLNVITLAQGHPPLVSDSVSFWAYFDQDSEGQIDFQVGPGETETYLKFKVDKLALFRYPDGTLFGPGDSVLITVLVRNVDSLIFDFKPAGLQFNPGHAAELELEFAHAGGHGSGLEGDFNDDGVTNSEDDDIESRMRIWVQENPNDAFLKIGGILEVELDEISAEIPGFSRFALAY